MAIIDLNKSTIRELNEKLQSGSAGDKFIVIILLESMPFLLDSLQKLMLRLMDMLDITAQE